MRILNCDRNEGNILVKKLENDVWSLIPIDHALSLPDSLSICDYELCWSLWPQIEAPVNPQLAAYLKTLDTRNNVRVLKKYLRIRPVRPAHQVCLRNFRIAETLLVKAVEKGLTLSQVSKIMYKLDPEGPPSLLESIVAKSEEIYSTVKRSVNKSLYLQLNCIHEKIVKLGSGAEGFAELGSPASPSEPAGGALNDEKGDPGLVLQLKPDKKTLFLESSQLDINNLFHSNSPLSSAVKKRAHSVYFSEAEVMNEKGTIRLEPMLLDKHRSPSPEETGSSTPPQKEKQVDGSEQEQEADEQASAQNPPAGNKTPPKKFRADEDSESSTQKTIKRTISNPNLAKKLSREAGPEASRPKKKEAAKAEEGSRALSEYDETFYYYYENILEQSLEKILHSKSNKKNRDRAFSTFEA